MKPSLHELKITPPVQGEQFNLADYLLHGKSDERTALVTPRGEHTYGELRAATLVVAQYLEAEGLKQGDRVILMAENSLFWVACYLGILKAGMVCVPLATDVSENELDHVLANTEPKYAFVRGNRLPRLSARLKTSDLAADLKVLNGGVVGSCNVLTAPANCDPTASTLMRDLAALMFTSGSTGIPRGVMISHGNIRANTESIIEYMGLMESDRVLCVLPFHYCFGTSLLHTHLRVGATLVLHSGFLYPEKVLQHMEEASCTGFAGVPSHFHILLKKSTFKKKRLPQLRWVQQAGGHLAPALVQELQQTLPDARIFVMYGQTEATARLSYLPPERLDSKLGSVGKGIPGVRLSVQKSDGTPVRPGEVGEIVAEGENVALGYWRAPEDTAVTFRDGRLHTGDLATVDAEGFITIVGRSHDFLKCGGKRVSCRELEEQLLRCPEVIEAAVIGVPDQALGEAVGAFVVPRSTIVDVETSLVEFCRRNLPFQLVPKRIVMLESLPKNSAGKVLKGQLRNRISLIQRE
jgi:long-chain acyl-CoA synthetase